MAGLAARLHLPRRTVRMRLALFCGALFLATGAVLLFTTVSLYGLYGSQSTSATKAGASAGGAPPPSAAIARHQQGSDFHQLLLYAAVALTITGVLAVPLGWLVAGRLLRPLRTITTKARAISATNLHERLSLEGPDDEFKELGETLDDLFGRLDASFESQRHFVANASHELRTPLAAERTLLQVALADPHATTEGLRLTCEKVLAQGQQEERLIDALLTLASSERGVERWESVDLATVADHVVTPRAQEAQHRGIQLDKVLASAPTTGDPDLLESLLANLVDNGLHHNVDGGSVYVATETRAGRAVVSVTNTGPVVPAEDVERLFEPFRRAGTDRTRTGDGHGLGLSIVRAVADAHGATVAVEPQSEGGLHVEVALPAQSPEAR
jgi:signal transduction histidine kinase